MSDNRDKAQHGAHARDDLQHNLEFAVQHKYVKRSKPNYRIGATGFDPEQFYAGHALFFENGEIWLIYSTTSLRTDRVKGQHWDAYNIKKLNPLVTKAFIVYPDSITAENKAQFESYRELILTNRIVSAIDDIFDQKELLQILEQKGLQAVSTGKAHDLKGKAFESLIASILNNENNLTKWNTKSPVIDGQLFSYFETLLKELADPSKMLVKIKATADKGKIGYLPSGGNAKTDVLVRLYYTDGTEEVRTLSCKKSKSKQVSVHEYKAQSFSDVLNKDDHVLAELLQGFQKAGSMSAFGRENCERLTAALAPYQRKLALWVLGGWYGTNEPSNLWASHVVILHEKTDEIACFSIEDYIDHLENMQVKGNFGTYFAWTYPSKKRGLAIQLKCKISF